MNETDDYTVNTELFNKTGETTTGLNIFKMNGSDLYDDEDDSDVDDYKVKKPRKGGKVAAVLVVAGILALLGIAGVTFGIAQSMGKKDLEVKLQQVNTALTEAKNTITVLSEQINAKDAEIETLKSTTTVKNDEKKDDAKKDDKSSSSDTSSSTTGNTGNDGSTYKVVSNTGMNIRAEASADSEVIASLACGDEFEQGGSVITASDGSLWVYLKWDNGYGCIQTSDGTWIAKLS